MSMRKILKLFKELKNVIKIMIHAIKNFKYMKRPFLSATVGFINHADLFYLTPILLWCVNKHSQS